jgi:hypothetical protein
MEKAAFLETLKELTQTEDVLKAGRDVQELKSKFEDFLIEEERLAQVAQLEAGEEVTDNKEVDPIREEFFELFRAFQLKRKDAADLKKELQENNLKAKRALITRLQDIIQNEENIGSAFTAYKEIHEKWKATGDIPREKRDEIQTSYSRLLEQFFYNMKIYRELKEHDLHRNYQLKLELIEKLKTLHAQSSIKELESQLKVLQNEWEEIGPVNDEQWETIKTTYWEEVRSCYTNINAHYDARREKLQANLEAKKTLLETVKDFNAEMESWKDTKDWDAKTKEILSHQEEWKKIGFGPKKENEEVYNEFRTICNAFFDGKKEFFKDIHSEQDALAEKKKKIVARAEAMKTSTDWKKTSEDLRRLQQEWKQVGHCGQRNEQKLWKAFRGACDGFFDNRTKHFEEKDKENEKNLEVKQAIIEKIQAYKPGDDKQQTLTDLKVFSAEFNEAGHVPMKQKDEVYKAFKTAIDGLYDSLQLAGAEKEKIMFEAKIDTMKSNPEAGKLLDREKQDIRKKIDGIKNEINLLENNLGFFGRSKGAEKMKQEYEVKIEKHKEKIESYKRQLKQIPNE